MKFFAVPLLTILFCCRSLHAADINITAEKQVEWHQNSQTIIAVGDAVATKEDMNIKADRLIGYYTDRSGTPKGKSSINRMEAVGNVRMHSPRADGFGDTMDYDLVQDVAILKGQPATVKTETETITAVDNITYYPSQQKAVAFGNVLAVDKDGNKLYSDKMVANFVKNNENTQNLTLDRVQIYGNVKILNKDTEVTADRGIYFPKTGIVKLFDNVIIKQDGNILRGDRAQSDLNSGISKLIAGSTKSKVKGVFKEKESNKDNKTRPASAAAPAQSKK